MGDQRLDLYSTYVDWKDWQGGATDGAAYFADELAAMGLEAPASVLEIGFGAGDFLDWCRSQGHRVTGTEVIAGLVEAARARGHEVHLTPVEVEDDLPCPGPFDLVVAFDVFEHLTPPELQRLLVAIRRRLAPDGKLLARFPNGGSPFSALYQNGDLTHRSWLSASAIDQLAKPAGLQLVLARNAAAPLTGRRRLAKRVARLLRALVETGIGRIYYGHRVPLDPNLVVVLRPVGEPL